MSTIMKRILFIMMIVALMFIIGCSHSTDKYMRMPANQTDCVAHEGGVFISGMQTNISNSVNNDSVINCCCTPKINEYNYYTCICLDNNMLDRFLRNEE